jgi:hypothetical protein
LIGPSSEVPSSSWSPHPLSEAPARGRCPRRVAESKVGNFSK